MVTQLETHYLDQQLRKAHQSITESQWNIALNHFQRAYSEALWLCNHFIEHGHLQHTRQSFALLETAAQGCIECLDSSDSIRAIDQDMRLVEMRMRGEFGYQVITANSTKPAYCSQAF